MKDESSTDLTLEGLVHDLNNVFETVSEAADLLSQDPAWGHLGQTLQHSVVHGQRLINSFRESTLGVLEFESVLDGALTFVGDFQQLSHGPRVEFRRRCDSDVRLQGLRADWERVLVNLLMNSVQAMNHGGVVEIAATHTGEGIEITVSDNGPGIAPEILPKIFQPHFSTKGSRTGLGLHIVESIVTKYGGHVQAANRPAPPGAAFSIHLPDA